MDKADADHRAELFPYPAEDLDPHSAALDVASEDAFVTANRTAIDAALQQGYDSIDRGDVSSMEEVLARLNARRQSRSA